MKKQLHFKSIVLAFLFAFLSGFAIAQNYETTKTLNKNATVSENATVNMWNYSGDLKITTSDANTVKIVTTVEISGQSQEDVDKVLKAIEDFDFNHSGNTVKIDTRFYKNMQSINNRKTITLKNGDKAKIRELKINHELQIPIKAKLELSNKYSEIEMQELHGLVSFDLYSTKIHADNILNDVQIKSKYSKIYLKEITGKLDLDIYDSDVEFISSGDVIVKSKYSKINAKKVGSLTLDSYDDKFYIDEISNLKFNAKYSDLVSKAQLSDLSLDLFDSNIEIKSAKKGTFTGKYSDLKLGNVKEMKIASSYDNDVYFGKTVDIQIEESKYSKYEIGEVVDFSMDGYDDNVSILKLSRQFSEISVKGKYGKLNVFTGNIAYRLDFKIKYPKIDIPESVKTIKRIEKSGDLELIANDSGGLISVNGYDMKVVIK